MTVQIEWQGMTAVVEVYEDGADIQRVYIPGETDDIAHYLTRQAHAEINERAVDAAADTTKRAAEHTLRTNEAAAHLAEATHKERLYGIV